MYSSVRVIRQIQCNSQNTVDLLNDTEFGLYYEKVWQNAFYLRMNKQEKGIYRCVILNTPIDTMKTPNDIWVISNKNTNGIFPHCESSLFQIHLKFKMKEENSHDFSLFLLEMSERHQIQINHQISWVDMFHIAPGSFQ